MTEKRVRSTAYFDCFSGAAGDMILAASIACGLPLARLKQELAKLKLPRGTFSLEARSVKRCGLRATYLDVRTRARKVRTSYDGISRLLARSGLGASVKERAQRIFRRLAIAEAGVHGTRVERVHFHEVGAIDSIVDIVGASIAVELLGIDRVLVGNVHVGTGTIRTAHGEYPVPSPAVLSLLKRRKIYFGGPEGEIMTPTGAAILAELADGFESEPVLDVRRVGYGAGRMDYPGRPNVLRLVLGEPVPEFEEDRVTVIEANIDDMLPLNYEQLFDSLFERGALDVTLTPIQMKKQRPAVELSVLAPPGRRGEVARYLLEETTSFGVRYSDWGRLKIRRRMVAVKTPLGSVDVKLGFLNGRVLRASPEYEDCKRLADRKGVPFMTVYEDAKQAARVKFMRGTR